MLSLGFDLYISLQTVIQSPGGGGEVRSSKEKKTIIIMDPNVARLIERTRARRAGLKEGSVDGSPLPR